MRRIPSIDIVRGAVMVLMALDHVRVYAALPAGGPSPAVFFTRWVTHVCAPAFVFLAGTAAFLYGRKRGSKRELAKFLLMRGLWLVLLELTVVRFAWTFNFDYANYVLAGVIWCIGWSMVILAALVFLPVGVVGALGVVIIAAHNAFGPMAYGVASPSWLLKVFYTGGGIGSLAILYTLIPWIGVMAAGYAFGAIAQRRRLVLTIGVAATLLFVLLRVAALYGDPRPWDASQPALLFLNTAKYPASLLFLLMTLGPTLIALALLENARGRVAHWLEVFGRVPFFYYLLHIPMIHLVAVLISLVRTPGSTWWLFANHPLMPPEVPEGYRWSLALLYLVTAFVVIALYFPCRWFGEVKADSRRRWARFL